MHVLTSTEIVLTNFMFYVLCDNMFISLLMCVCRIMIKGYTTYLLITTVDSTRYISQHSNNFRMKDRLTITIELHRRYLLTAV